jgi:hypothetical protein
MKKVFISAILLSVPFIASYGQEKYQDKNLPAGERAESLVKQLTLEEKVKLMVDGLEAIERVFVPAEEIREVVIELNAHQLE